MFLYHQMLSSEQMVPAESQQSKKPLHDDWQHIQNLLQYLKLETLVPLGGS